MLGAALPGALARPSWMPQRGTEYVGSFAGDNTGCASPGFTSIQDAVNAAPNNGTVYLCGNTPYAEPVVIGNKRLTLTGDQGATIQAPATWPNQDSLLPSELTGNGVARPCALVLVWGNSANATIQGLTISGPFSSVCAGQLFGIMVIDGASATIQGNTITHIREVADSGNQTGVGIEVGRMYWSGLGEADFVGSATIENNAVSDYQKNGITVDGPGTSATVTGNTVTGAGPVSYIAQNGIQLSRGATGQIRDNVVSGNQYTGTSTDGAGILLFGGWADSGVGGPLVTGIQVSANRLLNNDVGVSLANYNADASGSPSTPTRNRIMGNMIVNDAITNGVYQAGISDYGNQDMIMLNSISGIGYTGSAPGVDIEGIDLSAAISPHAMLNVVR